MLPTSSCQAKALMLAVLAAALLSPSAARAIVDGTPPTLIKAYTVQGDSTIIGNTVLASDWTNAIYNDVALDPQDTVSTLTKAPADARLVAAYVFWSASILPNDPVDNTATFWMPDGTEQPMVVADQCYSVSRLPIGDSAAYKCRADVTNLLKRHLARNPDGTATLDGTYNVSDFHVVPADPAACNAGDQENPCQGAYGGWALILVWTSPSAQTTKDVAIYDGFLRLDEICGIDYSTDPPSCDMPSSGISPPITLSGFSASDTQADVSVFGLEGDPLLGNPPQPWPQVADFLAFNGTRLVDGTDHPNNFWDSRIETGNITTSSFTGVDIKTVKGILPQPTGFPPQTTSVTIQPGSGDGIPDPGPDYQTAGEDNGEMFYLGDVMLSVNTFAPSFGNSTKKVDKTTAAPGDTLTYTMHVENDGTWPANVMVTDTLPAGLTYVPGSTTMDGSPVPDGGGTSQLFGSGVNAGQLWPLNFPGGGIKQYTDITFKGTINPSVSSGSICNTGDIDATYTLIGGSPTTMPPVPITTNPCTTVVRPDVQQPEMTATVPGTWPNVLPGDRISYTITIANNGAQAASGLSLSADLPKYVSLIANSVQVPFGATNASTTTGGANGTGKLQVNNITIPGNFGITITFDVQVFDDAAFVAAGGTDGTALSIQAFLTGPNVNPAIAMSDDPQTPAPNDPTTVYVRFGVDLSTSQKTVTGDTQGTIAPGRTLTYTIRLTNTGKKSATASVTDPLSSSLTNCRVVSGPITCGPGSVTGSNLVVGPGASVDVSFAADVVSNAADGTPIANVATLAAAERPGVTWQASAPTVTVQSQVVLVSTKSVTDLNGGTVSPGDDLQYTITLENTGNRASGAAVIKDALDPNLTFESASDGGQLSAGTVMWTSTTTAALASLLPNQTVTVTFRAKINANVATGTTISNVADSATPEASVASNAATVKVVAAPSFIGSTKTVTDENGGSTVRPGDLLDWNISIKNTGKANATNVVVTDPIDANLAIVNITQGGTASGNLVTWTLPSLEVGATAPTLTVVTRVRTPLPNGTRIPNQAMIHSAEAPTPVPTDDPTTPAPNDPTVVTVTSSVSLSTSTKTVTDNDNPTAYVPGDKLTYHISVVATGDAPAQNVTVVDPIQRCLDPKTIVPGNGGTWDGAQLRWDPTTTPALAQVVPGTPVDLTFNANITLGVPDGTKCPNQGFLTTPSLPAQTPTDDPSTPVLGDPTIITITSKPVLNTSTKVVQLVDDNNSDGTYSPGDKIRYTITVNNSGSDTARSVTLQDPLSADLTDIALSAGGVLSGNQATWSLGDIASRTNKVVTIDAMIVKPLDDGTVIDNQGTITATNVATPAVTDDPSTPVFGDPTRIVLKSAPKLYMSKVATDLNGGRIQPGDPVEYTLTLSNSGTAVAHNVKVTDPLDPNLSFVSASGGGTYDPTSHTVSFPTLASLDLTTTETYTIDVKIVPALDNGTRISNQAEIVSDEVTTPVLSDDPATPAPNDPTVITVISAADLSTSTKTYTNRAGGVVRPGDIVDYTMTVKNTGNAYARQLRIQDPIDPNLTVLQPIDQGGTWANGAVTWTPTDPLAPGASDTFHLSVKVALPLPNGTAISNQGQLFAQGLASPFVTDDPTTPAPSDPTVFQVKSAPILAATKTVTDVTRSGGEVHPGDELDWKITVQNTGDEEATNGVVTDVLDPNLDFLSATSGGTFDATTRQVKWNVGTVHLSPNDTVLTLATRVKRPLANGTVISNQGSLTVAQLPTPLLTDDPSTPAPNDPTRVTVVARPDLSQSTKVAIDLNGGDLEPNDPIEYDITVKNTGDTAATNVTITDVIDPTLTNVQPLDGGVFDGATRTITWKLATVDLSPAGDQKVRFQATVAPLLPNGTKIANQAFLASDETSPVPSNDPSNPTPGAPTVVTVVSSPQLQKSTKTVVDNDETDGLVRPGDSLTYTIVVKNTGNTYATDVVVEDPIDPQLTNVQPDQGGVLVNGEIRWDATSVPAFAKLAPGGSGVALTFRATIAPSTKNGVTLLNQANLSSAEGVHAVTDDPTTPQVGDPTAITTRFPDLTQSVKTVLDENGGDVEPGDWLTYTLRITNSGNVPATNVTVTDPVDPNLVNVTPGNGGTVAGTNVVWNASSTPALSHIDAGQSVTLTLRGQVKALTKNGTVVSNQASISATELKQPLLTTADPSAPTRTPTTVTVVSHPTLDTSTLAVVDPRGEQVRPGDRLTYTLTVRNTGNAAGTNAVVTLPIPPQLADVKLDTPGQLAGNVARWDESNLVQLQSVVPGTDPVMVLEATVVSPLANNTIISMQGQIKVDELPQPVLTDDPSTPVLGDPTIVHVFSAPQFIHSEKTITDLNGTDYEPGDTALYEIDVINDGTEPSTNTIVTDTVPPGTTYVPGSFLLNGQRVDDQGTFPLTNGMLVKSKAADAGPGVVIVQDGHTPDAAAVIQFRVQLSRDLVAGTAISNQASVTSDQTSAEYTDDPTTPMPGDPTVVVVGGGAAVQGARLTWKLVQDKGEPGVVNPGDVIEMRVDVPNNGDAPISCLISDLPLDPLFQPYGDLTLNGATLTAAADGDAGEWTTAASGPVATVRLGLIKPHGLATVTVQAQARAGANGVAVEQGHIYCTGSISQYTDSDPSIPGAQPARIPVWNGTTNAADLKGSTKIVEDLNGGDVEPGDPLRYRLTVENDGNAAANNVVVTDVLPPGLTYQAGSAQGDPGFNVNGQVTSGISTVTGQIATLPAGQRIQATFVATVDAKAPIGKPIANTAQITVGQTPPITIGPATVTVGGITGTATVVGKVYEDLNDSGAYDSQDWAGSGFEVQAYAMPASSGSAPAAPALVKSTFTSSTGDYAIVDLPPGDYQLQFRAPDGTLWKTETVSQLTAGETRDADAVLLPTGVVYRSSDASGVSGARMFLFYDDDMVGKAPPPCDEDQTVVQTVFDPAVGKTLPRRVGAKCLLDGQQGQQTLESGAYRFDLPNTTSAVDYQLWVVPPSVTLTFPSATHPPTAGFAPKGRIGAGHRPSRGPHYDPYYLQFSSTGSDDAVSANHIPLDSLQSAIRITKEASRASVHLGEFVTYTIAVVNGSSQDLLSQAGVGGLTVVDEFPPHLQYVRGSARALRRTATGDECAVIAGGNDTNCPQGKVEPQGVAQGDGGLGRFGPYDLKSGETLIMRYTLTVTGAATPGDYDNVAHAEYDGVPISQEAKATVRVMYDSIFDESSVIGKVFCDDDGNGIQTPGEVGIGLARVYTDTGFYAETDPSGKFHFQGLLPGLHLFKLDERSLPPGSTAGANVRQSYYLTPGLDARLNFPVKCNWPEAKPDKVEVVRVKPPPPAVPPVPPVKIQGSTAALALSIDGEPVQVPAADVRLVFSKRTETATSNVALVNGRLAEALRFRVLPAEGPAAQTWRFTIEDEQGRLIDEQQGKGIPPPLLSWDGTDGKGQLLLQAGARYRFQLELSTADRTGKSPLRAFGVSWSNPKLPQPSRPAAPPPLATVLTGHLFGPRDAKPRSKLISAIDALVAKLPKSGETIHIDVYADPADGRGAQELTDRRARAVKGLLVDEGVPASAIIASGHGATHPVAVVKRVERRRPSWRAVLAAREKNRRVAILVQFPAPLPAPESVPQPQVKPEVVVAGKPLAIASSGAFEANLPGSPAGPVAVRVVDRSGRTIDATWTRPAKASAGPVVVQLDAARGILDVGGADLQVPLITTDVRLEGGTVVDLGQSGPEVPLRFTIDGAPAAFRWALAVRNSAGAVVEELKGSGSPPEEIVWNGHDAAGAAVLTPGRYTYQLAITDLDGNTLGTANKPMLVVVPPPKIDVVLPSDPLFAGRGARLQWTARRQLAALAKRLSATTGSIVVESYTDSGGTDLTQERADAVRALLVKLGVKASRLTAVGRGATSPLVPNLGPRNRAQNRRIEVRTARSLPLLPAPASKVTLKIAGFEARAQGDGRYAVMLPKSPTGPLDLDWTDIDGRQVRYRITAPPPLAAPASEAPPPPVPSLAEGAVPPPPPEGDIVLPGTVQRTVVGSGPARAPVRESGASPRNGARASAPKPAPVPGFQTLIAMSPDQAPKEVLAGKLLVRLPADHAVLHTSKLFVRGVTDPKNVLEVNGQKVAVGPDGSFWAAVPLPAGESKVTIVAKDEKGDRATIERTYKVDPNGLFLMGIADAEGGMVGGENAGIDTMDLKLGGVRRMFLGGRVAGTAVGQLDASRILGGFFKTVRVVANVDSTRRDSESEFEDLLDPARYYPVWGDSSNVVQIAPARGPVYVRVDADDSHLLFGDFQTVFGKSELFRYDRTLYGGDLDFVRAWTPKVKTDVHLIGATGDSTLSHGHVEIQATGGSVYYLQSGNVVEGTEHVRIVVRDRDTGMELSDQEMQRDVDYEISYVDGRLLFKQPVSAISDSSFVANTNVTSVMNGNPVFIVVDYEYRDTASTQGGTLGGYTRESFWKGLLTVGGGYIQESRNKADPYRLIGAEIGTQKTERTYAKLEFGRSYGTDSNSYYSADGGLTYTALADQCLSPDDPACSSSGNAWKAEAAGDLADFLGKKGSLLSGRIYYQNLGRGYFADGALVEQGTQKYGGELTYPITKKDALTARHDSVESLLDADPAMPGWQGKTIIRRVTGLQYRHTEKTWGALGEYDDVLTSDSALKQTVGMDLLVVGGNYRVLPKLNLTLMQQGVVRGDPQLLPTWRSKLTTTLGAEYKLSKSLSATGSETVRWDGENATQLGLSAQTSKQSQVYLTDRLAAEAGQLANTTLVGGSTEPWAGGRAYGEYQLDNAVSGTQNRAVLGLENKWKLKPGILLSAGYERSQVLGDGSGTLAFGGVSGGTQGTITGAAPGATQGNILGETPYGAPGMNPSTAIQPGTTSRDVASLGIEYLTLKNLKASAQLQARYDNADPRFAKTIPGIADRLQFLVLSTVDWKWTSDLSFLARLVWADDYILDARDSVPWLGKDASLDARYLEATAGIAIRPVAYDWFAFLGKLSRVEDRRPLDLVSRSWDDQTSDVLSLAPTFQLPFKLAIAEKVAFKHVRDDVTGVPSETSYVILNVNRLDYHVLPKIDLSVEYRVLWTTVADNGQNPENKSKPQGGLKHGAAVEVAYRPLPYTRFGIGYNFSSFSDNELSDLNQYAGGFFVRATGQY